MSKKIFVEYSGVIRSLSGNKQEWIEIEDDFTVQDLLIKLGYRSEHQKFILVTTNGDRATLETPLKDKKAITLFLPAGGG